MLIALESTGLHFYPRPPRGGRRARPAPTRTSMVFLSTPSARRATLIAKHGSPSKGDFYPRPPRGGRLSDVQSWLILLLFLSTPSARRATSSKDQRDRFRSISIHALREEGDFFSFSASPSSRLFLSTPSARRATCCTDHRHWLQKDFYPRPPRGGRLRIGPSSFCYKQISIHALREEGDLSHLLSTTLSHLFLSTPSARRATSRVPTNNGRFTYFYPRPPRGGRLSAVLYLSSNIPISIHALREEGDVP